MKTLTPFGVTEYIPSEAKKHKEVSVSLLRVFEKNKYQLIRTPTLEYYDSLAPAMGPVLKEKAIRFFDHKGQLLLLRADHTTPIARIVSARMRDEALPIRLCYLDPVFRNEFTESHKEVEVFQAGLELIGSDTVAAEIEVIGTCIQSMIELGFEDFGVDIGHTRFIDGLSEEKRHALIKGDYIAFGDIPERGGVEIVSDLPDLNELYQGLKKLGYEKYVAFNKGLVRDLSYYSGTIFECHIQDRRQSVGTGGRYDTLLSKFGFDCPAVGFALSLNMLVK